LPSTRSSVRSGSPALDNDSSPYVALPRLAWSYRIVVAAVALAAAAGVVLAPTLPARIAAAAVGIALFLVHYLLTAARRPTLYYRRSRLNERVLAACPALRRRYWPTIWAFNRHLQIAVLVRRSAAEPPAVYDDLETITAEDGGTVALAWVGLSSPAATPTLVVLPTICGDAQSVRGFVRRMRARLGWRVVVCDRRGHGDLPLTAPRINTMGSTEDLRAQIQRIATRMPASPLYAVGLSAGSGLLVRYLGEERALTPLVAGVAYCPGYDISRAFHRLHPAYDRHLRRLLKEYFLVRHRAVLEHAPGFRDVLDARSVGEFHDRSWGVAGFESTAAYYAHSNPMVVAHEIRVPLLILNAEDDPVCVAENVHEHRHLMEELPDGILAFTRRGSHCAFFEGARAPLPWSERVIAEYVRAIEMERMGAER
jgi:predicted alpha/beta-fold hydrolase